MGASVSSQKMVWAAYPNPLFEQICAWCGLCEASHWAYENRPISAPTLNRNNWSPSRKGIASSKAFSNYYVGTLLETLRWRHCWLVSTIRCGPRRAALIGVQIQIKMVLKRWDGVVGGWERCEQSDMDKWAALLTNMPFLRTKLYDWGFDNNSSTLLSPKNWIMATVNDVTYLCFRISDYPA